MSKNRCFLCTKQRKSEEGKFLSVANCRVSSSQKPVQVVLQHLANCIKTKFVFGSNDCVCKDCYRELVEYDNIMVQLLAYQKKLTQKLNTMLSTKIEMEEVQIESNELETLEVAIERGEEHLADAFNPELDAQEEFITVVEDDAVIDPDCVMEDASTNGLTDESDGDDSEWVSSGRRTKQECVICGATFKSKIQLQVHVGLVHDTKTFTCDICGAVRRDEEYLELHMNIHEGKTENECRYCDKRYTRPVNTLRHMRKHWDKKKYQCEKCGERFSLDNMLYNHRMLHEAEENPLICSICNQSFKSRKTFNHHMTIHQENRPRHQCAHCSKSFTERYTLKMHMKTHGVELSPLPRTRSLSIQMKDTEEGEGQDQLMNEGEDHRETEAAVTALVGDDPKDTIACVICSAQFDNKETLEQHLQDDHDVILK